MTPMPVRVQPSSVPTKEALGCKRTEASISGENIIMARDCGRSAGAAEAWGEEEKGLREAGERQPLRRRVAPLVPTKVRGRRRTRKEHGTAKRVRLARLRQQEGGGYVWPAEGWLIRARAAGRQSRRDESLLFSPRAMETGAAASDVIPSDETGDPPPKRGRTSA